MAAKPKRKLMSDDPVTLATLTQFHREVLLPDVQRIVTTAVDACERRLRDEMHTGFDALAQRLDRLETEYHMLVAGLKRVEERLDSMEKKLEKVALRSELDELKARVDSLQGQIRALEERLSA